MRFLRGGLALWAFIELYRTGEWLLLFPGVIFGLQAIMNVGCGGGTACTMPPDPAKLTNAPHEEEKTGTITGLEEYR